MKDEIKLLDLKKENQKCIDVFPMRQTMYILQVLGLPTVYATHSIMCAQFFPIDCFFFFEPSSISVRPIFMMGLRHQTILAYLSLLIHSKQNIFQNLQNGHKCLLC